jgi:hypothetical protein
MRRLRSGLSRNELEARLWVKAWLLRPLVKIPAFDRFTVARLGSTVRNSEGVPGAKGTAFREEAQRKLRNIQKRRRGKHGTAHTVCTWVAMNKAILEHGQG